MALWIYVIFVTILVSGGLWLLNTILQGVVTDAFNSSKYGKWLIRLLSRSVVCRGQSDITAIGKLEKHGVKVDHGRKIASQYAWVYWPVKLRPFCIIHNAQCQVLKVLKDADFKVCLVFMDSDAKLSDKSEIRDDFIGRVRKIIGSDIDTCICESEILEKSDGDAMRKSMERVMRTAKYANFQSFAAKRYANFSTDQSVWQFITPAVYYALILCMMKNNVVYTLSGADELDMWKFIRDECYSTSHSWSHIGISLLNNPGRSGDASVGQIDMKANAKYTLYKSNDDLEKALNDYQLPESAADHGNLFVWIVEHFCCIRDIDKKRYSLGNWNFSTPSELFEDVITSGNKQPLVRAIVDDLSDRLI